MSLQPRRPLRGITPILVTAYDEAEQIAFADIERQVEHLVGLGVAAIGIGLGSDVLRQTERERDELIGVVAETAAGSKPVVASAGGNSVAAAVERATAALQAGASILMVAPPAAMTSPATDALVAYYASVGRETGAPIVLQDAPSFTGTVMTPDQLATIAREVPEVVTLKIEAPPSAPKLGQLATMELGGATLLGGMGGVDFYHELERGVDGTIPGIAMTELLLAVQSLHGGGERDAARKLFNRHLPLMALARRDQLTSYRVSLQILRVRGIVTSTRLRQPFPADPALGEEVETLLSDLEIGSAPWEPFRGG